MKCKKCKGKVSYPYDTIGYCEKCTPVPLRGWHKTKDGETVDKAYEGCIHYYRRDEITHDNTCHCFSMDTRCCEESKGCPCSLIQYAPGCKSEKIRYIYFKISDNEQRAIEQKYHLAVVGSGCK